MKKREFVKIIETVMEDVALERGCFTCNLLKTHSETISNDYVRVMGINPFWIPLGFGVLLDDGETRKQVRLNALAMYLAQSLEFKTYKDL